MTRTRTFRLFRVADGEHVADGVRFANGWVAVASTSGSGVETLRTVNELPRVSRWVAWDGDCTAAWRPRAGGRLLPCSGLEGHVGDHFNHETGFACAPDAEDVPHRPWRATGAP